SLHRPVHRPPLLTAPRSFFFQAPAPSEIHTLSLHDALPICLGTSFGRGGATTAQQDLSNADAILIMGSNMAENHPVGFQWVIERSEEHTSELQSLRHLVCRLLLEKKNKKNTYSTRCSLYTPT